MCNDQVKNVAQLVADIERIKNNVEILLREKQQAYNGVNVDELETEEAFRIRMSLSTLRHSIESLNAAAGQLLVFLAQPFEP